MLCKIIYCLLICSYYLPAAAQLELPVLSKKNIDTNYIADYSKQLTVRVFGQRKYTYYDLSNNSVRLKYRPNNNFNVGIGANYKFIGINIGLDLSSINHDNDIYGKTKHLDLQGYLYLHRFVVNFYGQYYKGYYIQNPGEILSGYVAGDPYPIRSDIYNLDVGLNVQYVFNPRRFSYAAAYLQNQYQKKSAGSFLAGAGFFILGVKGDSSIIPSNIKNKNWWSDRSFRRTGIISLAANGGYAYTLVVKQHYFGTASLLTSLGINSTSLFFENKSKQQSRGLQFNNTIRLAAGYNSIRYFAGISWIEMITRSYTPLLNGAQIFGTGEVRISLAMRFALKKKLF